MAYFGSRPRVGELARASAAPQGDPAEEAVLAVLHAVWLRNISSGQPWVSTWAGRSGVMV